MNWFKKLLSRKQGDAPEESISIRVGDLELVPSGISRDRAEAAMPGTAALPRLVELVPPPITLEPVYEQEDPDRRNYEPNPNIEVAARFPATKVFHRKTIEGALYGDLHKVLLCPTYYLITPEGRTTYLTSSDAPIEGRELIASWLPGRADDVTPETIGKAHKALSTRLAELPFEFDCAPLDMANIVAKFNLVDRIKSLAPDNVSIIAYRDEGQTFDGKKVWGLLHSMGFRWGDMDCFQWNDPTGQTDYLIWVEADDGAIGYVLPEMVAAGEQNFHQVRFSITPPRTPSPLHVLDQMIRAAGIFQQQTACRLAAKVDDEIVEGPDQLREAIVALDEKIEEMKLKPGCSEICMVR